MNRENNDSESSDSDIFIEKEIKPVKKVTVQQSFIIKDVFKDFKSSKTKKRDKEEKIKKQGINSKAVKRRKNRVIKGVNEKVTKRKLLKFPALNAVNTSESFSEIIEILHDSRENISKIQRVDQEKPKCCKNADIENTDLSQGSSSEKNNFIKNEKTSESVSPKKYVQKSLIQMFEMQEKVQDSVVQDTKPEMPLVTSNDSFFEGEIFLDDLDNAMSICHESGTQESLVPSEIQDNSQNVNSYEDVDEEKLMQNSELLSFLLKQIIKCEISKQIELQEKCSNNGKSSEKLLLESEYEILQKFFKLSKNACSIFVRMLNRKKSWHRVRSINYKDISNNLETEFELLHRANYVDTNIEDEDLKVQLDLLAKPEVLELCKEFKTSVKNDNSNKKETLISSLIKHTETQKSVFEVFKKSQSSFSRVNLLKSKVKNCLGMCIRLNSETFQTFYKVLLLSSFAHYNGDEEKRFSNELLMHFQIFKNRIKFPNYKVCSTVVFETQFDFEEYKNAIQLQDCCEVAMSKKNFEDFSIVCMKAKDEFQKLLNNNEYLKRISNLKSFLRKFSAGTVYVRILSKYCTSFQKKIAKEEVINTTELLLSQNLFLQRKRGEWYEILSKALENKKQSNKAAEVILTALGDSYVNDVQKLTLQLRGQLILKKRNCGINDDQLRNTLEKMCQLSVQEPKSIEIKGKALDGNQAGRKIVYVQECEDGTLYSSVEKWAISHYNSTDFPKGYHSEGSIVQSIYFLLFYDIIYRLSPEDVFQSPYQEAPLDFYSSSFYNNRKEEIDIFLSDMLDWSNEEVEAKIRYAYDTNYGTTCIINWREILKPELLCEVIKCITIPILVLIFQRLVKNFREVRSGFPDLTLWNPVTNKCKFVEVKSPLDKLSPAQRLWLDYLKNIGLDCEVCNVKNT